MSPRPAQGTSPRPVGARGQGDATQGLPGLAPPPSTGTAADTPADSVLAAKGLTVGYRSRRHAPTKVLAHVDLELGAGEFVCLLGPNGSGKSTLLRTLAGMQRPLAGTALLTGEDVTGLRPSERARRLAVVLTDHVDVGLLRATHLVALGRYPHTGWDGRLSQADDAVVDWALDAVGAAGLAGRRVSELSDGERQRVLIARALAQQPAVLALDEPVAFVDVPRRVELTQLLRRLARACGLAVLMTTHDLDLAVRTADRLWLLEPSAGPARVHVGAPEDLVLSGAVARAFHSDEVAFDLGTGTFQPRPSGAGRVRVRGDGPAAHWAARAMAREGLSVVADEPCDVEVVTLGGAVGPRWRVRSPAGWEEQPTIGALVAAVRRAAVPGAARPAPRR